MLLRYAPQGFRSSRLFVHQLHYIPNMKICSRFFFRNKDKMFEIIDSVVFCSFTK